MADMKNKKRRHGSKHRKVYTIICDWCGDRRETSREDTSTCGDVCRKRMANFIKRMGYKPDGIVGPFTTQDAVDKEVERLIAQERQRRKALWAERAAYLARPGA
jgi:hypothetical protein